MTDRDILDENRALGIVTALTEQDETRCSDCGKLVDVSEATTEIEVVQALEQHQEECSEVWFPD